MNDKLYYQDAYIQSFSAKLVKQSKDELGEYIVLSQTAFYPTGGGQPSDNGTIEDQIVVNVEEVDGEVRHYLESSLDGKDGISEVHGMINWEKRYDHMQQHAGQHILSAAFEELFGYKTVGFHLGSELLTIDLEVENLSELEAQEAENRANQIILENRLILTKWVTEEELSSYQLRKETKVKEDIRLVIIPDYDYNGCGGTHPKATGEVQAIKILNWEKQKKKIRVEFVCGKRVIKQLNQKNKVLQELTQILNSPEKDMVQAVNRLLENGKAIEKELIHMRENLLYYEAQNLLGKNESRNGKVVISELVENRTIQDLQKLARFITSEEESAVVLLVSQNEERLQMVCARGINGTSNMKNVLGGALAIINGKGGGSESFAQGGGEAIISGKELLEHLVKQII